MHMFHLFVQTRVVDGRGSLLGDTAHQLDLFLREDALALRLDKHEDAEGLVAEVEGYVETRLLPPALHRRA